MYEPIFHGRYPLSWDSATGAKKQFAVGNISRREIYEDVSFGIGTIGAIGTIGTIGTIGAIGAIGIIWRYWHYWHYWCY